MDHSHFIDFFDASELYLDMLESSCHAVSRIAELHDLDMLKPVSATLDHAVAQLKSLFNKYADLLKSGSSD